MGSQSRAPSCPKISKHFEISNLTWGGIRHLCNEYLVAIEMSIAAFFFVFSVEKEVRTDKEK